MRLERSSGESPSRKGRTALRLIAAAGVLLVVSCGGDEADAPLPPRPEVVEVTMREYSFARDRPVPPRGRVVFRVTNAGQRTHELTLLQLPEGFPPIEVQLRGKTRRSVPTLGDLHDLRPGASDAFAVDLGPGRYAMLCYIRDRKGVTHARGKGMTAEFRVQ